MDFQRTRALGLLLILTALIAAAALIQDYRFDLALARERAAASAIDREVGSIELALAQFRAAQNGYLAAGQGPESWMRRATELSSQMEATILRLAGNSPSSEARTSYEAAGSALADLNGIDKRAREQVHNDQRLLASDTIVTDSLDATERLGRALGSARRAETDAATARMSRLSAFRIGMNAWAMVIVLGMAVYAWRAARTQAPAAPTMAQMFRDLPPPVKPAAPVVPAKPVAATPPPAPPPAPISNLPDAAELCIDLARVIDDRDLPSLLERSAKVLDAKGVIVWIADRDGLLLRPMLTHGYTDRVIARLGTLDSQADNMTSLSFRTIEPQAMTDATGTVEAVAVPLITPSGCAGVLAAEMSDGKRGNDVVALARIIGAQFSTLVAPVDLAAQSVASAHA